MALSKVGLVKPCLKMGGPHSKTEYYSTTDSEPVRRLNGEKIPDKGSKKHLKPCAYTAVTGRKACGVPFA